jgi:tetratricopeptide (TPR) repeat protein
MLIFLSQGSSGEMLNQGRIFMNKTAAIILSGLLLFITACSAGLVRQANSSFDEENYRKSAELYAEYLEKNPGAFLARRKYGLALLKDNRPEEAVEQLARVIDLHAHDSWSLLYLGLSYLQLGDYQKTLSVWRQYEFEGKPLIAEELARQSRRLAAALPRVSNELVREIESAVEDAIWAHQLHSANLASRLEECGGGA